jgi:hypothetical protein
MLAKLAYAWCRGPRILAVMACQLDKHQHQAHQTWRKMTPQTIQLCLGVFFIY